MNTTSDASLRCAQWSRFVIATCVLIAPLMLAGWFSTCPQYGDPNCPSSENPLAAMLAFRSAIPLPLQIFLILSLLVPFIYPVSFIGVSIVAFRGAPLLATIGVGLAWLGSITWGFTTDVVFQMNNAAQMHEETLYAELARTYSDSGYSIVLGAGWIAGHVFGYIVLGAALIRSRAVPAWAGWLLALSPVLIVPAAYAFRTSVSQVLGFVFVFIASVPVASALVRGQVLGRSQVP
jgi:hypothetical protein